jgi:Tol biopolymer transport system component
MVLSAHSGGAFLPPDRILYVADATLMAREFNPDSGQVTGPQIPVAQNVATSSNFYSAFAAASNGTIAFGPAAMTSDLVWSTRDGRIEGTLAALGQHVDFRLSPNARRVALSEVDRENAFADVSVIDLDRGAQKSRITSERATDASPVWAPDGQQIVFRSNRRTAHDLYLIKPEHPGSEVPFLSSSSGKYPTSWSPDGRYVVYHTREPQAGFNVLIAEARVGSVPRRLLHGPSNEVQGQLSPDGRWLAYTSDESGTFEVYVRAAAGGLRKPVSIKGGVDPHWARNTGELYYIDTSSRRLAVVAVAVRGVDLVLSAPRELFDVRDVALSSPYPSTYDVTPDGTRFLLRIPREDVRSTPLAVLLNWTASPSR